MAQFKVLVETIGGDALIGMLGKVSAMAKSIQAETATSVHGIAHPSSKCCVTRTNIAPCGATRSSVEQHAIVRVRSAVAGPIVCGGLAVKRCIGRIGTWSRSTRDGTTLHGRIGKGIRANGNIVGDVVVHFITIFDVEVGTAYVPDNIVRDSGSMCAVDCQSAIMSIFDGIIGKDAVGAVPNLVKV